MKCVLYFLRGVLVIVFMPVLVIYFGALVWGKTLVDCGMEFAVEFFKIKRN